jgi:hypothetical protein
MNFTGRIIERVEFNAGGGAPKGGDDLLHAVGRSVRNRDAEADPGAHRLLALPECGEHYIAVRLLHFSACDQQIDELHDGDHRSVACISGRI